MKTKTSTIRQIASVTAEPKTTEENKNDDVYIYRPGMIPPCRQMFYQVKMICFTLGEKRGN